MWTCPKCKRIFKKESQPHSCQTIPISQHFDNKQKAKELFDILLERVNKDVGTSKIISLPCCIHLFGKYDYFAALPKKDHLEIRFASREIINSKRVSQNFPVSKNNYKICMNISQIKEIDEELIHWIKTAYHLKD